jgi:plastocyanin
VPALLAAVLLEPKRAPEGISMRAAFALALVLSVFVAGCGGSKSPSGPSGSGGSTGSTGSTVSIRGAGYDGAGSAQFSPGNLSVSVGTLVAWENTDSITHSVVSNTNLFRSDVGPGGAYEFRFTAAGAYGYTCTIHPGMAGTITVR